MFNIFCKEWSLNENEIEISSFQSIIRLGIRLKRFVSAKWVDLFASNPTKVVAGLGIGVTDGALQT